MKKNSAISGILQPTELHELYEGRSSQLYAQLMQLRKESLKKNSGVYGIRTLDLCDTGAALYQLS